MLAVTEAVVGHRGLPERLILRREGSCFVTQLEYLPPDGPPFRMEGYFSGSTTEANGREHFARLGTRFRPPPPPPREPGMLF